MSGFLHYLQRRPLLFSILAFAVSLPALSFALQFGALFHFQGRPFVIRAIAASVVSLAFSLRALFNLIKVGGTDYSAQKCSLAVIVLFLAFVAPVILIIQVFNAREPF